MRIRLPVTLEGLTLRRLAPEDFADLAEYWCDLEVARYQFWGPYTSDQVAGMIESQAAIKAGDPGVALVLGIVSESDAKLVGDCQLTITSVDDRQGEIGFAFNSKYTGRGLATRAVIATLGVGFQWLHLHRIVGCTDTRNERSWRLMERIGMRREAHFRQDCFVKGQWIDNYVYAMLDEEWRRQHAAVAALLSRENASPRA
jgi:RimJ/RimL family protein N-acetyltransferase